MASHTDPPAARARSRGGTRRWGVMVTRVACCIGALMLAAASLCSCGGSRDGQVVVPDLADGVWDSSAWDRARWQ